jgi:uncharacterized membrane protein YgcG
MNEKLYDALEVCLKALETGVDIEAVLALYPQMADDLRPMLEASLHARSFAVPSVPEAVIKRGRARVLQHAAGMRASGSKLRRRRSIFAFPRLAASLAIALIFLLSGTSLVRASSGALPGDNLYPVKRSWEGLRLFFIFSPEGREGLESEFEQERLDEISELLTERRHETIAFVGLVTLQNNQELKVSGISVVVTSSSRLPAGVDLVGAPVMVIGHTNAQGFVEVDTLELLGPGASLPPLEPSHMESPEREESQDNLEEPEVNVDLQPKQLGNFTYEFQGVVESKNGNIWTINGQSVNVGFAEALPLVSIGSLVEFEGYYSEDGEFIVIKIEVKSSGGFKTDQASGTKSNDDGSSGNSDSGGNDSGGGSSDNGGDDDDGGGGEGGGDD